MTDTCKRCGSPMHPGQAIEQTWLPGVDARLGQTAGATLIAGGPGRLVPCMKCSACGWSVTDSPVTEGRGEIDNYRSDAMTTTTPTEWAWNSTPPGKGWYAVMYGWDIREGSFVKASYWDGEKWADDLPINTYAGPFTDEESAAAWAHEHDPEGY